MKISTAFEKDTLSNNTQIIPLVVIEKKIGVHWDRLYYSTHNIDVQNFYFQPLLTDIPKFKNSVDLKNGKVKSSNVSIKLKNIAYNNVDDNRPSSILDHYSLINTRIAIYYKSQSCTKIVDDELYGGEEYRIAADYLFTFFDDDRPTHMPPDYENGCVRIFNGYIRDVTHNGDIITINSEDIVNKKMNKDIPVSMTGTDDLFPEIYKNVPYPMAFGRLTNAPTIVKKHINGNFMFFADKELIKDIIEHCIPLIRALSPTTKE